MIRINIVNLYMRDYDSCINKKKGTVKLRLIITSFFLLIFVNSLNANTLTPDDIVYETTQEVLKRLESDKALLEQDPDHIKTIVRELIIPHMDFDTMTGLVTGDNWKKLDSEMKTCVSQGFRDLLVERYAYILLSYRNQDIAYQSAKPIGTEDYVSIIQTLTRPNVKPLTIEYPMRPAGDSWKVVDLIIDDVSLVRNYRKMFDKKIKHQGIYGFAASFPECN